MKVIMIATTIIIILLADEGIGVLEFKALRVFYDYAVFRAVILIV